MFKGLGNIGNIASMMGALQGLPQKLEELNERMRAETVDGESACGRVRVVMNGMGQTQSVSIESGLEGGELEAAVLEANNAAGTAAKALFAESISKMTEEMDLNLPGLDGILTSLTGG